MKSAVWDTSAYREEGAKARTENQPKHANPYDYVWEGIAAIAWDAGWDAGEYKCLEGEILSMGQSGCKPASHPDPRFPKIEEGPFVLCEECYNNCIEEITNDK